MLSTHATTGPGLTGRHNACRTVPALTWYCLARPGACQHTVSRPPSSPALRPTAQYGIKAHRSVRPQSSAFNPAFRAGAQSGAHTRLISAAPENNSARSLYALVQREAGVVIGGSEAMALQPGCIGQAKAWHGCCQARQQCCARGFAARAAVLHAQRCCMCGGAAGPELRT